MSASAVDYNDIQGLVRFGYRRLTESCFLLLNVRDASATRSWLSTAPVATAVDRGQAPETSLQLAFTRDGLQGLGVPEEVIAGFSAEFLSGMAGEESRSRRLGDVGANAPQYWLWGANARVPHVLAMLYAKPGRLEEWAQTIQGASWDAAFEVVDCLPTSDLVGVEPFGFPDGISEPTIDWDRRRVPDGDQLEYGNLLSLGEFLLGYPNEYGKYTDRPLLDASDLSSSVLPFAEDVPDKRDLGRNGTYLIFRHLQQDVRGFWRFLDQQAGSNPQARQALAESMVGRQMNGDPLVPLSQKPIAGIDAKSAAQNQFTYDSDRDGTRCPFGAHVRRGNPRNADLPAGSAGWFARLLHTLGFGISKFREDVMASSRFHRLVRRTRIRAGPVAAGRCCGRSGHRRTWDSLHLYRRQHLAQFEFVQNAWIMSTKFNAMTEESDPLLGNREAVPGCPFTNTFSMPQQSGVRDRIMDLPQFVTVRGGAYFFLPSLSALRYLAALGSQPVNR